MSDDSQKAASMVRSFSLYFGLAWVMVIAILLYAAVSTPGALTPVVAYTLVVGVLGAAGAYGAWRMRRWGALLFLAALVAMLAKGLVFQLPPVEGGLPWGYAVMTGLYAFVVYQGWRHLTGAPNA